MFLDPEKLFIVLIVALVLLGPDKLPKLARQIGGGWAKMRAFQERIESEVRETMPDLPSTHEIVRMARSPVTYLNSLADMSGGLKPDPSDPANTESTGVAWPADPAGHPVVASTNGSSTTGSSNGHATGEPILARPIGVPGHEVPADPGMN
ncbi:MAG: twin-arginine translocase TatA/TatE family subunit [Acidimicrobiales bacterium]